jgi:hypothetical protein
MVSAITDFPSPAGITNLRGDAKMGIPFCAAVVGKVDED